MTEAHTEIMLCGKTPRFTKVDLYDVALVSQYKWFFTKGYVKTTKYLFGDGTATKLSMARIILRAPEGMDVDHINGDKLDNRRCNLRLVTRQQNNWNRKSRPGSSSRFKGVTKRALYNGKQWEANIIVNGEKTYLGRFASEEDAAMAYDKIAIVKHGEFARLNFPELKEVG